jgi:hypothetical protein
VEWKIRAHSIHFSFSKFQDLNDVGLIPSEVLKGFGVSDKVVSGMSWKYCWEIECRIEGEDEDADAETEDDEVQIVAVTETA